MISVGLVGLDELSARETTVFQMVVRGLRNRQISEELCITERTAKFHVRNLLAKCGCRTRSELLALCLSRALGIESEPIRLVRRRESQRKWEAAQRDRDAGVPVSELAKKYSVSGVTIYAHTQPNKAEPKARRAGHRKRLERLIEWEKVFGQRSHAAAP
jgi:DNA-binding CsgD family transcriptional regulator